jgi:multiple sugar transport system substrate-binding protein
MKGIIRLLAVCILALLATLPVVASGSQDKPAADLYSKPVTLTMLTFQNTTEYQAVVDAFNEQFPNQAKNVKFNIVLAGSGDGDLAQKLRLQLAANQDIPDTLRMNYTQVPEFAAAGVLYDISKAIAPYKENILPGAFKVMQYNNKFIAYPYEVKSKLWYYRADIFAEAGIDPTKVKTLDDFIAAGKQLQAKFPGKYIENYGIPTQQYDLFMRLTAFDGALADAKGNYTINTDPNVRKAFESLKKLRDSGVVDKNITDFSQDYTNALVKGTVVSQLIGNWFKKNIPLWAPELKGKWAAVPWPEEIRAGSEAGGGVFVIPEPSKNKEVTADILAKMHFDPLMAHPMFDKLNKLQYTVTASKDEYLNKAGAYFGPGLAATDYNAIATLRVYPYDPASSREIKIVMPYVDAYLTGKMTIDEALQAAQNDCVSQIGNAFRK